jgi:uncharacterized membrane protein
VPRDGSRGGGAPEWLGSTVERNITALVTRRKREQVRAGWQQRLAAAISRFAGSMLFIYIHVVLFGGWIAVNAGWIPGVRPFDPSFVVLAMFASVEAIFLSTFVLINQNQMAAAADRRADLDLQISLLAEHEVTRLITLTTAIARKLDLAEATAPELSELAKDVQAEHVLDEIERTEREMAERDEEEFE